MKKKDTSSWVEDAMNSSAPERIYNWLDSQFSIARFYGGITYNGHKYTISPNEPACPLVRNDVIARELKAKKIAEKKMKQSIKDMQQVLP